MHENTMDQLFNYAWRYFQTHAEQRLKTFNFYLVVCAIIIGALSALLKDGSEMRVGIPIALLLPFLSFIFWKLDLRNKQLISHGENALKYLENQYLLDSKKDLDNILKIFNHEEQSTKKLKRYTYLFTYSTCFNLVFFIFSIGGIIVAYWLLIH